MAALPIKYAWLAQEGAPKILVEALKLYGTQEIPGPRHSPLIMGWLAELGFNWIKSDETPWCGTAMAICAKRAGKPTNPNMPSALWWLKFGTAVMPGREALGDILVFGRAGGGHVGLYVGEDSTHFHVLGGNQSNQFSIARILKTRLAGARRTAWTIAQPGNVRKIWLSPQGTPTSHNEA